MGGDTDVLIVGAGPTGLVLALWLTRLGVKARIVDKAAGPGETSRALAVHARTLELLDQVGLAEAAVSRGRIMDAARLWVGGKVRARAPLGDMGRGLSPFPYVLILPQDANEKLLEAALAAAGVEVERRVELTGFQSGPEGVLADLAGPDGKSERVTARFIAGCDGARSVVRQGIGAAFPGGEYSHLYYVADIEARGPVVNGELNLALDEADFLAVFPLRAEAGLRLVGAVEHDGEGELTFDDVGHRVIERLGLKVERVNWFSTYRVHHRVAGTWRAGGAFLLGDAAHIHSPVGGQGMNTGMGDAVNLAWKLAAVLNGQAAASLLDTFEPERIAFARRLVATTDRAFQVVTRNGPVARFVRLIAAPLIIPVATRVGAIRRLIFRTLSQIGVTYRGGPLASGAARRIAAGDRLPWVGEGGGNFACLRRLAWQGHVYGAPGEGVEAACAAAGLPLEVFPWSAQAAVAGIARDAFHLIRPDGYVGLIATTDAPAALAVYQARHGLRFGG